MGAVSDMHVVPAVEDGGSHPGLLPTSPLWRRVAGKERDSASSVAGS